MEEQGRAKKLIIGTWKVVNTELAMKYNFDTTSETFYQSGQSPKVSSYRIVGVGDKLFIKRGDGTSEEISAIGLRWMLWVKGGNFFVMQKM